MIKISSNVTIRQILEVTDKDTNETKYLILDDDDNEWRYITQDEYNEIRGYKDGK